MRSRDGHQASCRPKLNRSLGHQSLSPFLWNWTWPPSRPSYKAYSNSTTLPLTRPRSRSVHCHSHRLSPFLSISLCIFIKSSFSLPHSTTLHYTMPDASKPIQNGGVPSHLVSLPSLANSLSKLPHVQNRAHVSVYTSGQHAAESEAKVSPFDILDTRSSHRRY